MKSKYKILITIAIILLFKFEAFTQENLKNVKATSLNYKNKEYGVSDLNLLIYPTINKVRNILSKNLRSSKCKVYIKLEVFQETKNVVKERILSNCKFEKSFDYEGFIRGEVNIYITSINLKRKSAKITIPLNIPAPSNK